MYTLIAVGTGIVIGILLSIWMDMRNTSVYRRNFKRNLEEWIKNDNHKT